MPRKMTTFAHGDAKRAGAAQDVPRGRARSADARAKNSFQSSGNTFAIGAGAGIFFFKRCVPLRTPFVFLINTSPSLTKPLPSPLPPPPPPLDLDLSPDHDKWTSTSHTTTS